MMIYMKRQKNTHYTGGWVAHGACVAKERGLGFVKKRGHFCLIKTYVFWLNLDGLIDSL